MAICVGDKVRPKTERDAFSIGHAFTGKTTVKTIFEVLVVVECGYDYHGYIEKTAYILRRMSDGQIGYPYTWNHDRFIEAKKT